MESRLQPAWLGRPAHVRGIHGRDAQATLVSCFINTCLFAGINFGVFQGASAAAISSWILPKRATRKNAKSDPALRVALKMARRLRCSSVTDLNGYAPSSRLGGGPF